MNDDHGPILRGVLLFVAVFAVTVVALVLFWLWTT